VSSDFGVPSARQEKHRGRHALIFSLFSLRKILSQNFGFSNVIFPQESRETEATLEASTENLGSPVSNEKKTCLKPMNSVHIARLKSTVK
jgi:hypothetical protein